MPYPQLFVFWLLLLACAAILGAFREKIMVPILGETAGRMLVTAAFIVVIFIVARALAAVTGLSGSDAWRVGLIWLVLTVVWEIFMGRVLMKLTWREIFADYNIFKGRLWPLVLAATLTAPYLMR